MRALSSPTTPRSGCTSPSMSGATPLCGRSSMRYSLSGSEYSIWSLKRKRSSCDSGSSNTSRCSYGFCVAMTRNGSGRRCALPSTVTWRSCIASSRAAWVRGGAPEQGLGAAGRALEQHVPVRESGHEQQLDCPILADDDLRDLLLRSLAQVDQILVRRLDQQCHSVRPPRDCSLRFAQPRLAARGLPGPPAQFSRSHFGGA